MAKIVISYRRADSLAIVGRIFDRLRLHFDRQSVFMDIDNIPAGADFRRKIEEALRASDVMLVVVGRNWAGAGADGNSSIHDAHDFVRIEVETALALGLAVIPVLVDGARMPLGGQLPEALREFAFRNAATVDAGQDFDPHMERLVRSIKLAAAEVVKTKVVPPQTAWSWSKASLIGAGGVAVAGVAAAFVVFGRPAAGPTPARVEPAAATSPIEVVPPVLRREVPASEPPKLQSAENKPDAPLPAEPPSAQASRPSVAEVEPVQQPLVPLDNVLAVEDRSRSPDSIGLPGARVAMGVPSTRLSVAPQDFSTLVRAAAGGQVAAQWKLARMYAEGDGVAQSDIKAFEYFRRLSDEHADERPNTQEARFVANAFVALGRYYATGIPNSDVKADPARARQMFSYAASYFGDPDAQYQLANLLLQDGSEANARQAARWLASAANKGQHQAQAVLGRILLTGQSGVPKSTGRALMMLSLAREGAPAEAWIGELYEQAAKQATEAERQQASELLIRWINGQRE